MKKIIITFILSLSTSAMAKIGPTQIPLRPATQDPLLTKFSRAYKSNKEIVALQKFVMKRAQKAVPALIEVMKNGKYPEKNRWVATFLLGKIVGKKSAPFMAKFLKHPSWFMRMASLKVLLALRQKKYASLYREALKDSSLMVRRQALENIRRLKLGTMGPHVWKMLYDKRNYYAPKGGAKKRAHIIKTVIKTIGELKFKKAQKPMFKMIQKKQYKDIFPELDYSLSLLTNKKSPKGKMLVKKHFWKTEMMKATTI